MKTEVYNPKGFEEKDLPIIYGFNNGGAKPFGGYFGQLIAQDGVPLD